ncbi:bifunctional ornithine acetyltransferase/N-acetylglutamate synthase [Mechercharimyces sp. CAU 1602]|uniref:bifunctional ornithine acetyltransferase/N-acetylglutamate synthase n=1 Tax=Mechercharimyces sp. CAU 1602 TaxID=2973933 RepID=UPI002163CAB4|nr:bifunctional ornithine acetyltransferase/N-acetylglutamate synthase [Mechercharimyces sp. CAU 1602]MCS1350071.1 bifunctional ornithine acetyltransferase/N-acetylglutamate synthase [Mechercharimyces sp. CAU 1602]
MGQTELLETSLDSESKVTVVSKPDITAPKGFFSAGLHCGIRRKHPDLGMIYCENPAAAAAVYTTNAFQAAPLKVTQTSLAEEETLQAILVNSGVANSCTGEEGLRDAYEMRKVGSDLLGLPVHRVAVVSTGLIGTRLPMEKVTTGLIELAPQLGRGLTKHHDFARSILTTDTKTKESAVTVQVNGEPVTVAGTAKGSGMIHPNMATMLGFMTTDANISSSMLHQLLKEVTDESFNMITVDGDTSTNDMVLAMASGQVEHEQLTEEHPDWQTFREGFLYVARSLAMDIARDGEGATRLIEARIKGASSVEGARKAAKAIVGSNLVKSAVFGQDANWGRIVCAVGYGDSSVHPDSVDAFIGPVAVVQKGLPLSFDEDAASQALQEEKVVLTVNLHQGTEEAVAWGCDLTYEYVKINACYRT